MRVPTFAVVSPAVKIPVRSLSLPLYLSAALCLGLGLAGCATIEPSVPQDIVYTSIAAEVRSAGQLFQPFGDGNFEVGPYRVTGIKHGVVRGDGVSVGPFSQLSSADKFSFMVQGARLAWTAQCHGRGRTKGVAFGSKELSFTRSGLRCELHGGAQRATLELDGLDGSLFGSVRLGDETFGIRQYFHDDPVPGKFYVPGPLGLRIDRGNVNVGALALARPGTFWLNPKLAPAHQDAMAGVLAALLIDARRT